MFFCLAWILLLLKSHALFHLYVLAPWYNDDLRMMKTSCRKVERNLRLSGLTVNYEAWKDCLQEYKVRIVSA